MTASVSRSAIKIGHLKEAPQLTFDIWHEGEEPPAVKPWQMHVIIESQKPLS